MSLLCSPELQRKFVYLLSRNFLGLDTTKNFIAVIVLKELIQEIKKRTIRNIKKITSGSTARISIFIDKLYKQIIDAGTYRVKSIKIAEAAKVIENAQRDLNIAFC